MATKYFSKTNKKKLICKLVRGYPKNQFIFSRKGKKCSFYIIKSLEIVIEWEIIKYEN